MNRPLQQLIEALREELQQCGEMLAQLEDAARLTFKDTPGAARPVPLRGDALLAARQAREFSRQQLAWAAQKPHAASIAELISSLPQDFQPMVDALVEETEDLWRRLYERLRQDRCWLQRARETSRLSLDLISHADGAGQTQPLRIVAA